jgi:hypothetical protein
VPRALPWFERNHGLAASARAAACLPPQAATLASRRGAVVLRRPALAEAQTSFGGNLAKGGRATHAAALDDCLGPAEDAQMARCPARRTALLCFALLPKMAAVAQPPRQPEVVCDLTTVLIGRFVGSSFVREDLAGADGRPLRLTFREVDPKAGTARMVAEPDTFDQAAAVTVEDGAITYLQEQPNVGKMIVATRTKPTDQGWPATMSQHGWSKDGGLFVRTASGICRMRARRPE